jgi:hypothetical protein
MRWSQLRNMPFPTKFTSLKHSIHEIPTLDFRHCVLSCSRMRIMKPIAFTITKFQLETHDMMPNTHCHDKLGIQYHFMMFLSIYFDPE